MSTLSKVFVVLVSALSIFLCGAVVSFVARSEDWKAAYQSQMTIAEAAQVYAETSEEARRRDIARYQEENRVLKETMQAYLDRISQLVRDFESQSRGRAESEQKAASAVSLSQAVQQSNQSLHEAQQALQKDLEESFRIQTTAEARTISLNQQLNNQRALVAQLDSKLRVQDENLHELENENERLRQRLQTMTVASNEFRPGKDPVSLAPIAPTGVPIRGEVLDVEDELASISTGSASGVREGTRFHIVRGGRLLGSLEIQMVEPNKAAGRLYDLLGTVVPGDAVTTGF